VSCLFLSLALFVAYANHGDGCRLLFACMSLDGAAG
jgi:hypothetical protein